MIFFAGICLRTGIASLAPVLDLIQADLQSSQAALGVLTAIPVICMGVLSPCGSYLEQKIGLKKAMLAAFLLLLAGFLLRLDARTFTLLLFTAMMIGIADAIIRPLLSGFIKDHFAAHASGAMSIYAASMGMGSAMAAYLTLPIAKATPLGWRAGLAIWGIPTLIGFFIWLVGYSTKSVPMAQTSKIKLHISTLELLTFTLFFALQAGINYTVIAWLPSLFKQAGIDEQQANFWMAIFIILQTITSLFFATLIRLMNTTHAKLLPIFVWLGVISLAGLPLLQPAPWFFTCAVGIATGGLFPLALLLPIDFSDNKSEATKLSGITQSGGYLLGGLLPWLAGLMADNVGIYRGLIILLSLLFLALLLISLMLVNSYRKRLHM